MSNTKSVEQQLKEAIEASKQTLALNEQVTALASEKDALSKRLAEVESALSAPQAASPNADEAIIKQLAALVAEREVHAKQLAELKASTEAALKAVAEARTEAAEARKSSKADLNKYVELKEEGEFDKEDEACGPKGKAKSKAEMPEFIKEKIKEKEECAEDEDCEPRTKGKKASKAEDRPYHPSPGMRNEVDAEDCDEDEKKSKKASKSKAYDHGDFGDLDDEEIRMIKHYRQQNEGEWAKGKAKKADSDLSNPTKEDEKDFDKQFPQPGLNKNSKKADSTISNPSKEESKDFDNELHQPGLDPAKNKIDEDNTTSPTLGKKAAKASKKGETDVEEIMESPDMQEKEDESDHEHEKTLSKKGKKAENSIGGVNKVEVTRTKEEVEESGKGSFLNKKDAKAEDVVIEPVAEETAPAPESGQELAAINPVAAMEAKLEPQAATPAVEADPIETIVTKFAKMRETLAFEAKAKTEAHAAVEAMNKKFEALAAKLAALEATDKSVEMKAAKLVSASGVEPVAAEVASDNKPKTDADVLAEFEAIKDKREQNKFFNANRGPIERAAFANLKQKKLS